MASWMRNQLAKLDNAVSASVAATRNTLTDRLQSVRKTAYLLYTRMTESMGYGQERLKDIVEKETEEEEAKEQQQQPAAMKEKEEAKGNGKNQQHSRNNNRMMMSDMIRLEKYN